MEPFEQLRKQMAEKLKSPTVFFDAKENDVLSGLALWRKAHDRRHQLRSEGFKKGDLYFCTKPNGFEFLVDLMACIVGHYRFFPCHSLTQEEKQKAHDLVLENPGISVLLATGGTVQRKIIGLTESNLIHQIQIHAEILKLKPQETRLCLLPWTHSFGFVLDLLLGIYNQQTLVIAKNSSTQEILKSIQNYDVQHMACVPRHLEALKQKVSSENLKNVQVHFGGASLSKATLEWCKSNFGNAWEGYGLTEAGPGVLMNGSPCGCLVDLRPSQFENLLEIWVKPVNPSFWERKSTSADEYFNTFDLGKLHEGLIQIEGRNSDLFKTSSGRWKSRNEFTEEIKKSMNCEYVDYNSTSQIVNIVINSNDDAGLLNRLQTFIQKSLNSEIQIEIYKTDVNFWSSVSSSRKKSIEDHLRELKAA